MELGHLVDSWLGFQVIIPVSVWCGSMCDTQALTQKWNNESSDDENTPKEKRLEEYMSTTSFSLLRDIIALKLALLHGNVKAFISIVTPTFSQQWRACILFYVAMQYGL